MLSGTSYSDRNAAALLAEIDRLSALRAEAETSLEAVEGSVGVLVDYCSALEGRYDEQEEQAAQARARVEALGSQAAIGGLAPDVIEALSHRRAAEQVSLAVIEAERDRAHEEAQHAARLLAEHRAALEMQKNVFESQIETLQSTINDLRTVWEGERNRVGSDVGRIEETARERYGIDLAELRQRALALAEDMYEAQSSRQEWTAHLAEEMRHAQERLQALEGERYRAVQQVQRLQADVGAAHAQESAIEEMMVSLEAQREAVNEAERTAGSATEIVVALEQQRAIHATAHEHRIASIVAAEGDLIARRRDLAARKADIAATEPSARRGGLFSRGNPGETAQQEALAEAEAAEQAVADEAASLAEQRRAVEQSLAGAVQTLDHDIAAARNRAQQAQQRVALLRKMAEQTEHAMRAAATGVPFRAEAEAAVQAATAELHLIAARIEATEAEHRERRARLGEELAAAQAREDAVVQQMGTVQQGIQRAYSFLGQAGADHARLVASLAQYDTVLDHASGEYQALVRSEESARQRIADAEERLAGLRWTYAAAERELDEAHTTAAVAEQAVHEADDEALDQIAAISAELEEILDETAVEPEPDVRPELALEPVAAAAGEREVIVATEAPLATSAASRSAQDTVRQAKGSGAEPSAVRVAPEPRRVSAVSRANALLKRLQGLDDAISRVR